MVLVRDLLLVIRMFSLILIFLVLVDTNCTCYSTMLIRLLSTLLAGQATLFCCLWDIAGMASRQGDKGILAGFCPLLLRWLPPSAFSLLNTHPEVGHLVVVFDVARIYKTTIW